MNVFHLSGTTPTLRINLHNEISNHNYDLKVGLIGFYSMYLLPNVTANNNSFIYNGETHHVPVGQYNASVLETTFPSDILLNENHVTHRMEVTPSTKELNLGTIGSLLGFKNNSKLQPAQTHVGQYLPKFLSIETFNIHCNLARGMIVADGDYKHKETNIIATFKPLTEFLEPIVYEPQYPLFFPIQESHIRSIEISVTNEKHEPISFGGAITSAILMIKSD